ncbi:MAG: glucosamine-6-phosphate deaminase, partial [Chloroflexota bacterium]|nr:glucosamine-6-phosphate deaminase [Chloroflexota bacterium]
MSERAEKVPVTVLEDDEAIAQHLAERIATLIRSHNDAERPTVLGLATGSTPIGVYRELIRLHVEGDLDFSRVITFNLDEYYPMDPTSIHSYHRFMWENLFDHINIPAENVHIPRGDIPREAVPAHCAAYEAQIREAGGIDFQLLGIGQSGHIGFNEPGSGRSSRTRLVTLDTITRRTAASDFFGEDNVPLQAITMGIATIMEAREIALVAIGEHKAAIVQRAVEGRISASVAATYLQQHPNATVYLDPAAATMLTRIRTPWLLGEVEWTPQRIVQAVTWLSEVTGKSVLKLEDRDYRENHLGSLLAQVGSAPPINGRVFNLLISKIRGKSKLPRERRIIVFSPHPDDDVISAGGLLRKLHENGNDIVVAYQTSGNIAVFDHEVRGYMDFLRRTGTAFGKEGVFEDIIAEVEGFLAQKQPGEVDSPAVQAIKRTIREAEAVSAIQTFGMRRNQACFLNLPFYQTGRVRKEPISRADVQIVLDLLEAHQPNMILAAGDLSDPHGTHRMCLQAIEHALDLYSGEPPQIWFYRGAWQEWPIYQADALVPMSQAELERKLLAIFKHQSQKDKPPFPGIDEREFWQRVEERNKSLSKQADRLGLPEYYAMEAYVVRRAG